VYCIQIIYRHSNLQYEIFSDINKEFKMKETTKWATYDTMYSLTSEIENKDWRSNYWKNTKQVHVFWLQNSSYRNA